MDIRKFLKEKREVSDQLKEQSKDNQKSQNKVNAATLLFSLVFLIKN